ncbi:unnamed protein product [Fructobacillus fructosus]|uniref:helix-turn-helix domain-containing protein n=1 Tax=Fructobacillus fructosus TaxID=1631 RepID=UPI002D9F8E85|nr:unnamed protein product [Fructobacillus fructosus]
MNSHNKKNNSNKVHKLLNSDHIGAISLAWLNKLTEMPLFKYVSSSVNKRRYLHDKERLEKEAQAIQNLTEATDSILKDFPNSLDQAVKYLRNLDCYKMNQVELAEAMGVPKSRVIRLESKSNENHCSDDSFVRLCLALNLNFILQKRLADVTDIQYGNSPSRIKLKIVLNDPYLDDIDSTIKLLKTLGLKFDERKEEN